MRALITGASSGIGKEIAILLSKKGYDIIAVAREREKLEALKREITTVVTTIQMDLAQPENCKKLYELTKEEKVDILVNNAGFGDFGEFVTTSLEKEMQMIQTNIEALHILTKLFLQDMKQRDKGYILNVASIAGFMPGPLMATYYASKAYVVRLSQAIYEELKKDKSNVSISLLCPGPVNTNFNTVAGAQFNLHSMDSKTVASYAIHKMFKKKLIILPGLSIKCIRFLSKLAPDKLVAKVAYQVQEKKR